MNNTVYVVTRTDLGWDCVVAVYTTAVSLEALQKEFPEDDSYVISDLTVRTKLESGDYYE